MPIFHVNFDLKPGTRVMGSLHKSGNELVKAMQINAQNRRGGGLNNDVTGTNTGNDAFKRQMIGFQGQILGMEETHKQLQEGKKILDSVKNMVNNPNGVIAKINFMKELWRNMTDTGRELRNEDLRNILKIKDSIKHILNQFAGLRYNGISIFARKVNVTNAASLKLRFSNKKNVNNNADGAGEEFANTTANLDFVRFYEQIRQNLVFIEDNITNYTDKEAITRTFTNCDRVAANILLECNKKNSKFNEILGMVHHRKKNKINERNETIRNRQQDLSVQAVVSILDGK